MGAAWRLPARGDLRTGLALVLAGGLSALAANLLAPTDPLALGPAGTALQPPGPGHP